MDPTARDSEKHLVRLRSCLELAMQSPALPSNYRVGAILVHSPSDTTIAAGYTNERPGNTHAEQVCLIKLAEANDVAEDKLATLEAIQRGEIVLYTTVEPCVKRLSGNKPCVERILNLRSAGTGGIETIYVGVKEPDTFVKGNAGQSQLEQAGIRVIHLSGMEEEILQIATAGHIKNEQ